MQQFVIRTTVIALALAAASGCSSTAATTDSSSRQQVVSQQASHSEAELAQLLAPIALYPDSLLSHILIASTYPLEVVQAQRWLAEHPDLQGDAAVTAARTQGWDPSVQALTATPAVVKLIADDLAWLQALGEAVLADEALVLASIQTLREQAYTAGNLEPNEQITVQREHAQRTIVIETVRREVIYVPYYDPRMVYGSWRWQAYPPVYWPQPSWYIGWNSGWSGGIFWGLSYHVPSAFYFSYPVWPQQYIVVHHHHYQQPRYRHPPRQQVIRDGQRWAHNPEHRRGVKFKHSQLQDGELKYQQVSQRWQGAEQQRQQRAVSRQELDRQALETRLRQAGQQQRQQVFTPQQRQVLRQEQQRLVLDPPEQRQRPQRYQPPQQRITPIERQVEVPSYTPPVQQQRQVITPPLQQQRQVITPPVQQQRVINPPVQQRQQRQTTTPIEPPRERRQID